MGLAFDGDGDRLIAVDETGHEISGDHIIAICARQMKASGDLRRNLVVITPMSNLGLRMAFDTMGVEYLDADVGDRHVLGLMDQRGAVLGGEQSGHIIFRHHHTTGDGIISALQLLVVMQRTGRSLSELARVFEVAPQVLINVQVARKPKIDTLPEVVEAIEAAEAELGCNGRILVRYSGTQAICRVMVEAATEAQTQRLGQAIAEAVKSSIGV